MFDQSGQFELQVCPNGRAAADEYLHQNTMWIEGREGSKYILRFINRSSGRVCVIFSVDGLDTIKGQPAGPRSEGYVIDANTTLEVPGWKLDNTSAAEFYFNKIGKSYAATSGANTSNVGVIGAMVFKEAIPNIYQQYLCSAQPYYGAYGSLGPRGPMGLTGSAGPAGTMGVAGGAGMLYGGTTASAAGPMYTASVNSVGTNAVASAAITGSVSQDVGTGFGDAIDFKTTTAVFARQNPDQPDAMLVLYYNTAKNLQKMGITIRTKATRYDNTSAKAFPAYSSGCKPPPGWVP